MILPLYMLQYIFFIKSTSLNFPFVYISSWSVKYGEAASPLLPPANNDLALIFYQTPLYK